MRSLMLLSNTRIVGQHPTLLSDLIQSTTAFRNREMYVRRDFSIKHVSILIPIDS